MIFDHYNQLTKDGLALFKSGMYEEARKKYESSKNSPKVPENNDIDARISQIDSIITWKNLGDIA
ncbi:hypothetical protein FACS1894160_1600 [Bacteroidia bacterium]|nr:hypothetical protein FACS1894123_07280 [Bacteroidia bacterium]GHV08020.1 hypothetical protein FACS1894160_1600 [Bacteroidia bacterium]